MPAHFATETELRQWLAKTSVPLDEIPRGAGRNQSSAHTALVRSCFEWLQYRKVFCWRNNCGAVRIGKRLVRFGVPGHPDIIGATPISAAWATATLFGLEIKSGNGRQTADQREMQRRFEKAHALYLVVRNLDELEKWFA